MNKLYVNTVTETLFSALTKLMAVPELNNFRLVGGTALSLRLNHRLSVDIDLFTDAEDLPDPICLKGKFWELIKMDLTAEVEILVKEK